MEVEEAKQYDQMMLEKRAGGAASVATAPRNSPPPMLKSQRSVSGGAGIVPQQQLAPHNVLIRHNLINRY